MEKLVTFFSKIKEMSFWQRLFSWQKIKSLSYDAYSVFESLRKEIESLKEIRIRNENLVKKEQQDSVKIYHLENEIRKSQKEIANLQSTEEQREERYNSKVAQLNRVTEDLRKRQQDIEDKRLEEQANHFNTMKLQWKTHERNVEDIIKMICQRHIIEYVDKVPFAGSPDNTIKICGEYIIFDSKSPGSDNLSNFPRYIQAQVESIKKYIQQEDVKKDVFLVIPFNTVEVIQKFFYNMAGYNVFIITPDALEPIIISLKKIEEYEFAEELTPEERNNICRVIGKFAHTTKRKIQIDSFFNEQFIELLVKCKNDLPKDILESVIKFEGAEKLNPPTERRNKQIITQKLKENNEKIKAEARIRGLEMPSGSEKIKKLLE